MGSSRRPGDREPRFGHARALRLGACCGRTPDAGVIQISQALPIGRVIDELILVAECGFPADLEDRVTYLPL
jgi:hypothetical protein